jgi:ABC-2 type transport system ATP-binding protein
MCAAPRGPSLAAMISATRLTKRYGETIAVAGLDFEVRPGIVTALLGPNGAGKSTTLRLILGLDRPSSGSVVIDGRAYRDLPAPMQEVGALIDAKAVHGKRSARAHLRWLAEAGAIPRTRVDEVLAQVGLAEVAGRTIGGFSLGMSQRLGIAAALLGDPPVLLFDEPINGLDPEGIRWIRNLMRRLAGEGRTVVVSSHVMSELEATADRVLVLGRGRMIAEASVDELTRRNGFVRVVSPDGALRGVLEGAGGAVSDEAGGLAVSGLEAAAIGDLAAAHGLRVHELTPRRGTLEAAFMELTRDSVEYR